MENSNNNIQNNAIAQYPYGLVIAFLLCVLLIISSMLSTRDSKQDPTPEIAEKTDREEKRINTFADVNITARSAFVFDARTRDVLYEKNARTQLPLASITKLMTALTASEMLPQRSTVTILPQSIRTEGNSNLRVGERWEWRDLLDFTLISSSNDGADALAHAAAAFTKNQTQKETDTEELFVREMNNMARSIGLQETYFINETGLDSSNSISGAYGSARDVAYLMEHLIQEKPEIIYATRYPQMSFSTQNNFQHTATNTNDDVTNIPGLIASKTGYTDLAGGNLAIAFDTSIGHPVIVVVLGSTYEDRFRDVKALAEAARDHIQQQ